MADFSTLKVETKALVEHGSNRLEDALACEGLRMYLAAIGQIPRQVFGEVEISVGGASEQFYNGWIRQIDSRSQELASIRDALWIAGCGLLKAAGDYEHTDIEAMYNFNGLNDAVDPGTGKPSPINGFVKPLGDLFPVSYHPGGSYSTDFQSWTPPVPDDTMNLPGNYTKYGLPIVYPGGEQLPSVTRGVKEYRISWNTGRWAGSAVTYSAPNAIIDVNPGLEQDTLVGFMTGEDQGVALSVAEGLVGLTDGGDTSYPLAHLIEPAFLSSPAILLSRRDLLNPATSIMNAMVQRVEDQLGSLKLYWAGEGGAEAYFFQANFMLTYLKGLEIRIASLPTQCDKLGSALATIRNAYAADALANVKAVSTALDEYVASLQDSFCPDQPLDVVQALQNVYNVYKKTRTLEIDKAAGDIATESTVNGAVEKVSMDDIWTSPLPYRGGSGGDAWADGPWKPKSGHLSGYEPEAY